MRNGIGLAADQSGVNVETIRYYERIGLVPAPPRDAGGRRVYSSGEVRRLAFIRRARALGFSLDDIGSLLALSRAGGSCDAVKAITEGHLERVRGKIAELERMARVLGETAARCADGTAPGCPIIDALDR